MIASRFVGILLAVVSPLAAQTCSTCTNLPDLGSPIDDACTQVIVSFGPSEPGDCTFRSNNPPLCLPDSVCLFTMTITVTTKSGCANPPDYTAEFCTEPVDNQGHSNGGTACAAPTAMLPGIPSSIPNWPVACGRKDFLRLRRKPANDIIASPGGACAACQPIPEPTGGD
jgi:hypothetical protein